VRRGDPGALGVAVQVGDLGGHQLLADGWVHRGLLGGERAV